MKLNSIRAGFLGIAASASFLVLGALGGIDARADEDPIVLRGITPWVEDYDLSQSFFIFKDLVEEKLAGKVEVQYLGGPEIAAPEQQLEALRNGVVDVILGAAAYYRAEVPAAAAVQFTQLPPTELRKSGYYDLMREIHRDQAGVIYLANTSGGNKFRMYMTKKISKPDFSGLKIRVSPVYAPLVRALNGAPISMPPGDVYTGLERGTIDGYGWTYTGIDVFGWHEVSNYVIDHPFYSLDGAILINEQVWEGLPDDVKQGLEEVGVELEKRVEQHIAQAMAKGDERLKELGMEFIRFSPEDAEKYVQTAYEAGWADFLKSNAAYFEKHPGLAEKLQQLGQ